MNDNLNLFESNENRPLADRLRPEKWEDFEGLLDLDPHLIDQLKNGKGVPPSLVLWGPPGCGKTTFARLVGKSYRASFVQFSAVLGGVKDVRTIVARAKTTPGLTILFVDEIHRFNKAQQDAFLPHIEDGTIILIGATTENPSFSLNNALLSRVRVIPLEGLSEEGLTRVLERAEKECGITIEESAAPLMVAAATGDARRLCNMVEGLVQSLPDNLKQITDRELRSYLKRGLSFLYDRSGDEHYNIASAFIKSMRGSDPDAALYWGFRMLEGGEDPRFLIRRMIIFASEDIGNADPRAMPLAVSTLQAYEHVGLPEGRIPIAQCITYLATAPKSNRSYLAMHAAVDAVKKSGNAPVPLHLRNAPTELMRNLDFGKEYVYPHDTTAGYAPGVTYLPDVLRGKRFYEPSGRGAEKTISERLAYWRNLPGSKG